MKFTLENVTTILPNAKNGSEERELTMLNDGQFMHINIFDDDKNCFSLTFDKDELTQFRDGINMFLKKGVLVDD